MRLPHLHVIGHTLCPYVQRVVIVLNELNIAYEQTNIELDNKPDWLLALSPTGNIPILIVNGDQVLFESAAITEYLADLTLHSLYPEDRLERARHRAWAAYGDQILNVFTQLIYNIQTEKEQDQAFGQISQMLTVLEPQLLKEPYFGGPEFQYIDIVFASVFQMLKILKPLAPVDLFEGMPNVSCWRNALSQRPSVKDAAPAQFENLMRQFIATKNSYIATRLN